MLSLHRVHFLRLLRRPVSWFAAAGTADSLLLYPFFIKKKRYLNNIYSILYYNYSTEHSETLNKTKYIYDNNPALYKTVSNLPAFSNGILRNWDEYLTPVQFLSHFRYEADIDKGYAYTLYGCPDHTVSGTIIPEESRAASKILHEFPESGHHSIFRQN